MATLTSNRYVKSNYIGETLLFIIVNRCYNEGMKVIPREAQGVVTNSAAIRNLRATLSLSEIQFKVLFGSMFGDGSLVTNSWGRNYRLQMQQSERQKKYLFWKYEIFKDFVLSPPKYEKATNSWKFRTISHSEFTRYRKIFYHDRKKKVPININEILTHPLSLAVWYMDDGALTTRKDSFILNTQSFSRDDNIRLQKCLEKNFHIKVNLNRDKSYWRLYIRKESATLFEGLIKEHVMALMNEKLLVAP